MTRAIRFRLPALAMAALCLSLPLTPDAWAQDRRGGGGSILHTAAVAGYDFWLGQRNELPDQDWSYGATIKYFGGSPESNRLGLGVNWMHSTLDVSSPVAADDRSFTDELVLDRVGVDLYYGMPANDRNEVPYFLAGGGRLTAEGDTAAGETDSVQETFWQVGMGIINGDAQNTAFALELKYIGKAGTEIREDNGIIELSMSLGYNW
ncbi:hypothetical protein AN478_06655 [Thiohalorhabdus denitrificans]|uniref:Uncharacterized protein n=1 Tax=Thiohalorhabdus denitrificans TaxID=381306 RepID=A0A0P9EPQ2_9GAMM|nr:hypothetical protein [Thiohalorhabdus denitrificans]KPV40465.1 hypothetical protein AN478_06655 [Thiohalorhabdus denitrificans]SCY61562.1 hypothetical protein SAMN05661077_2694 [Thiohalorhabdus denitrificans]